MITSAVFAALHYLGLGIGLGSAFMRGRYLRALQKSSASSQDDALKRLFWADNFYGLAAMIWLSSGVMRAFGGIEKGTTYYMHNHLFLTKMGIFFIVFILELWPMITFIRWRIQKVRNRSFTVKQLARVPMLARINDLEVALIIVLVFIATLMARGLGTPQL